MRTLKLYIYSLLVLLFAVFIIQNYSILTYRVALRVNLGFLSLVSIPLPLFLIVPIFFFCGFFLATFIGWREKRRLSRELKKAKNTREETSYVPRHESKQETGLDPRPVVLPLQNPTQELKQESNQELMIEPRKESEQKPQQEPTQESTQEPQQEPRQEPDSMKISEDGTIVSKVRPIKAAGSPEDNAPPMPS